MQIGNKSGLARRSSLLATRRGNVIIAVALAVVAAILLVIFLHGYKKSLTDNSIHKIVVAQKLIPKGSSADLLAQQGTSFKVVSIRQNQLKSGAITSQNTVAGEVAVRDIFPGEQITAADFAKSTQPIVTDVQGTDRAVSIPVDQAHGLIGEVKAGDYVDVMATFGGQGGTVNAQAFTRLILRNVLVLKAPNGTKGGIGGGGATNPNQTVVLRVDARKMPDLAFASDNGQIWLALRPKSGAVDPRVAAATLAQILSGSAGSGGTITVQSPGQKPVKITVKPNGGH